MTFQGGLSASGGEEVLSHELVGTDQVAPSGHVVVDGGVLVRDDDGVVVGAVGVSGHQPDQDEACAIAGIVAADLAPDPGADAH